MFLETGGLTEVVQRPVVQGTQFSKGQSKFGRNVVVEGVPIIIVPNDIGLSPVIPNVVL